MACNLQIEAQGVLAFTVTIFWLLYFNVTEVIQRYKRICGFG